MGYTPASCDNNCKGCQMNADGWCTFKDRATPYYKYNTASVTYNNTQEWKDNWANKIQEVCDSIRTSQNSKKYESKRFS